MLIKDLVSENQNKRELIVSHEKEIKELKKTKFKLLGENAQIRKQIIDLLEALEGEKNQVIKTSNKDESKSDDALQEEVNQNHANPEEETILDTE